MSNHAEFNYAGRPFGSPVPVNPLKRIALKAVGLFKPAATATVLRGQDSVGVTAMSSGLDVYCGYEAGTIGYANGGYTTMPQVYSHFPGKRYISVGRDAIDIEPGLASAGQAPAFFRAWKPVNTNKPVFYADASDMPSVISALTNAGIARSSYYVWVAEWDDNPAIPSGYDAKQYASNNSFDSDSFASYMFGTPVPVNPWPLALGSTGSLVTTLQTDLNNWRVTMGSKFAPLTVDGNFGALTEAAVAVAQKYFGDTGLAGTASQTFVANNLAKTPGGTVTPPTPPPPPPAFWVFAPVTKLAVPNAGPTSFRVEFDWDGSTVNGTPAKFEVAVCEGSKLTTNIAGYPRYIPYIATGSYSQSWGGLQPGTEYLVAVRVQLSDGTHSSPWATATFKTTGTAPKPPVTPPVTPPPANANFPLKLNSTDTADVKTLQARLNAWGFGSLTVDGIFGPNTAAAVSAAQTGLKHHEPASGQCDQTLFSALQANPPKGKYPVASQATGANSVWLNGQIMYGYFRTHGFSPMAAAGAIASIWGESEWNPESAGTGGNGLIGWTPPLPGILTGNPGVDMAVQLPLILSFVANNGDQYAVNEMQNAASVLDAANLWGIDVERYGINDVHSQGVAYAKQIALELDGVTLP